MPWDDVPGHPPPRAKAIPCQRERCPFICRSGRSYVAPAHASRHGLPVASIAFFPFSVYNEKRYVPMAKGRLRVEFSAFFPMWGQLTAQQQAALCGGAFSRKVGKGEVMHSGDADCTGLLLVQSGQLRAFMLSPEGREITLYRLFQRDLCLLSASCMMRSISLTSPSRRKRIPRSG